MSDLPTYALSHSPSSSPFRLKTYGLPSESLCTKRHPCHHLLKAYADLAGNKKAGAESHEVRLFGWDEIPWPEVAFPSVHWALGHHREMAGETGFAPRGNPPGEFGELTDR